MPSRKYLELEFDRHMYVSNIFEAIETVGKH